MEETLQQPTPEPSPPPYLCVEIKNYVDVFGRHIHERTPALGTPYPGFCQFAGSKQFQLVDPSAPAKKPLPHMVRVDLPGATNLQEALDMFDTVVKKQFDADMVELEKRMTRAHLEEPITELKAHRERAKNKLVLP